MFYPNCYSQRKLSLQRLQWKSKPIFLTTYYSATLMVPPSGPINETHTLLGLMEVIILLYSLI